MYNNYILFILYLSKCHNIFSDFMLTDVRVLSVIPWKGTKHSMCHTRDKRQARKCMHVTGIGVRISNLLLAITLQLTTCGDRNVCSIFKYFFLMYFLQTCVNACLAVTRILRYTLVVRALIRGDTVHLFNAVTYCPVHNSNNHSM